MEKRCVYLTVRVDFECPKRMPTLTAEDIAQRLAINPRYNEKDSEVELIDVDVRETLTVEC